MSFQELGLSASILRAVLTEGYETPTPIQLKSIPLILQGKDVLGSAQTGTGKTAAFALPILDRLTQAAPTKGKGRRIRVLVLVSTRELALQIHESFSIYGQFTPLRYAVVYGGVGQGAQVRALQHGVDVLIATPGRMIDLMEQGYIDLQHVQTLILDEADRMLDMGFLPAIRRIMQSVPEQRQTLLFSATMPEPIAELANSILRNPARVQIAPAKKTTDLIEQSVYLVPQKKKTDLLIEMLGQIKPGRALVFARTKFAADRLSKQLVKAGIKSDALHSNKSQNARQRILAAFKWQNPPVLVATDIAARGIDVDNVTHVFNFDLPQEPETYVHRVGRAGRAGTAGCAISFCDHEERRILRNVEKLLHRKLPVTQDLLESGHEPAGESRGGGGRRRSSSGRDGDAPRKSARSGDRDARRNPQAARSSRPSKFQSSNHSGKSGSAKPGSGKFTGSKFKKAKKPQSTENSERSSDDTARRHSREQPTGGPNKPRAARSPSAVHKKGERPNKKRSHPKARALAANGARDHR